MELRAAILKLSGEELKNLTFDWKAWDAKLGKSLKPLLLEAIKQGVNIGQIVLDRKKTLNEDQFEHRINSYLQLRVDKLTGLNQTTKTRLENAIRNVLTEQIEQGASLNQQVDAMRDAVRGFFNLSTSRSRLIARTESAGAVNGGSMLYYENEGVEKKQWITAHDEHVRDSHRACEQQGAIPIHATFKNGLMFPSDQSNGDAGEVCNCRCSLLPVVE
jgi:SPP1 gp7 family putative phage head morphogenesis protein